MRRINKILACFVSLVIAVGLASSCGRCTPASSPFLWENTTVYFLLTDRFCNGNEDNDHSYSRGLDADGNVISGTEDSAGSFHGGDFAGVTQKIKAGYFADLGVTAIWITPPYEQIHGYCSYDGLAFYAYHGYWGLDYTQPDANYGTKDEFREMVDTAHKNGIRIVMDIVLNHPGYASMLDASEYGFGEYDEGWQAYYYGSESALSPAAESAFADLTSERWQDWWGPDWVRTDSGLPGYDRGGSGDTLSCLSGLPDFKTESTKEVGLPPLLVTKWTDEGRLEEEQAGLDKFFSESGLPRTVLNYQIKWLTDWVREYGIDGFRCDTAKHVDRECWAALKEYASDAFEDWKKENPGKSLDDTPFWTVGEVWDHGVVKDDYFTAADFDALINFSFRKNVMNYSILPKLYTYMSDTMEAEDFNVLSYISSHDTALFTRSSLIRGGNALLLAPGAVQIYYGDESGRPREWTDSPYMDLTLRSDMNWGSMDEGVLEHFRILGQFRSRHLAVGAGKHTQISEDPYIFARVYGEGETADTVVVVLGDPGQKIAVPVSGYFADGETLKNAYDGSTAKVSGGTASFDSGANGVILLEAAA